MIFAPRDILSHLKKWLPQFTNLFTTETNVSAEIIAGTPQILRVTTNNTLQSGDKVVFVDSLIDNGIIAVSLTDGILRLTTNKPHDLTVGYNQATLIGFSDNQFNGTFDLYNVPTSTTFEIELDVLPMLNGNEILRENREIGLNTDLEVASATSTSFDVELIDFPEFDTRELPQIKLITNYRISVVNDIKRLEEIYTKQPPTELWLFVIMEDVTVSKDRNVQGDANYMNTSQNEERIVNIGTFSLVVIIPTANQLTAASAVNLCYDELFTAILQTIAGLTITENTPYKATMIGHGSTAYNRAYYGHAYTFEQVFEYNYEQTFTTAGIKSSAFRRINISFEELTNGSYLNLED